MPPVRLEPTISAGEGPQTDALDSAVSGIGTFSRYLPKFLTFTFLRQNLLFNFVVFY